MRLLIMVLGVAVAMAYGADKPTSGILACAKVAADAERLSCYDELARGLRTASAATAPATATPAPAPAISGSAPTQTSQAREFGLPPVKAPPPDQIKSVNATVTATHHGPNGALIIELDNGQRWQQLGATDMDLEVGDAVTISRAMLGSFWLAPPSGRGSKVSRLH